MSDLKAMKITNELYLVGNTRYYMEYIGSNCCGEVYYRLIDTSGKTNSPVKITTDKDLSILKIGRSLITQEEAAVCEAKGMIVPVHFIRGPARYQGVFSIIWKLITSHKPDPKNAWSFENN